MELRCLINGIDMSSHVQLGSLSVQRVMGPGIGTASLKVLIDQTLQPRYNFAFFDQAAYGLELGNLDQILITDAVTENVLFRGFVVKIAYKALSPSEAEWTLDCQDSSIFLDTTVVTQTFTNTSDQNIIQSLFPLALPEIDTSDVENAVSFIPKYEAKDVSLQKVLTAMSDLSGATWYLDSGKRLHYHLAQTSPAPFSISDTPFGVTSFDFPITNFSQDYTGRANRITVLAGADETKNEIRATVQDLEHQSRYGHVYSLTVVDRGITSQDVAQMRALSELIRRTRPAESGTFLSYRDGLEVGQTIQIDSAGFQVVGQYTIRSLALKQITPTDTVWTVQFGDRSTTLVSLLAAIKRASAQPVVTTVPDGSVTGPKLAPGAVTGDKIGLATITAENIDTVAVGSLVGKLDISQVENLNTVAITTFTGSLPISQVSDIGSININSFEGVLVTEKLAAGILSDLTKFSDDLRPITKVQSLPSLPNPAYPLTTIVLNLADSKLYKNASETWQTV